MQRCGSLVLRDISGIVLPMQIFTFQRKVFYSWDFELYKSISHIFTLSPHKTRFIKTLFLHTWSKRTITIHASKRLLQAFFCSNIFITGGLYFLSYWSLRQFILATGPWTLDKHTFDLSLSFTLFIPHKLKSELS